MECKKPTFMFYAPQSPKIFKTRVLALSLPPTLSPTSGGCVAIMGELVFCHFDPFECLRVNSGRNLKFRAL
jgi:hypothetical protein